MRHAAFLEIVFALGVTSCSRAGSNASTGPGGGGNGQVKAAPSAASNSANGNAKGVVVPDPHKSTDPRVGREAGVGDDPSNLEAADPKGNGGDSGKPGPAHKP